MQTKSDCVQVDILIGTDNYISFVSPYAPKTQAYGMWVDKTYFDEILLNGKIPGSSHLLTQALIWHVYKILVQLIALFLRKKLSSILVVTVRFQVLPVFVSHQM